VSDVIDCHRERVRAADPLVTVADLGEDLIETANAVGAPSATRADPDAPSVHWGPLTTYSLHARVAGDNPADALGGLLDRWISTLGTEPGSGLVVAGTQRPWRHWSGGGSRRAPCSASASPPLQRVGIRPLVYGGPRRTI
jgi:hypothetical protein